MRRHDGDQPQACGSEERGRPPGNPGRGRAVAYRVHRAQQQDQGAAASLRRGWQHRGPGGPGHRPRSDHHDRRGRRHWHRRGHRRRHADRPPRPGHPHHPHRAQSAGPGPRPPDHRDLRHRARGRGGRHRQDRPGLP
ncbi:hypothetical protein AZA_90361 [Nitrospirillum viridazoti Y2]|nr:hypothetical protein AZA_90361 [Nitrospirillum amazonense Y2]